MAIGDIIVGMDIGTSKVSIVIGEVNNFNQIEVIYTDSQKCRGIKKGKIIDEDEIVLAVTKLIKNAEIDANLTINSTYITIPGKYVTIVQNSILKDAKEKNIDICTDIKEAIDIDSKALLLKVYEFTEVLVSAALKKEPHLITNYVYELASMFHNYYGKHKILTDDIKMSEKRLGLIKTVGITITNALRLIGVKAPEKM